MISVRHELDSIYQSLIAQTDIPHATSSALDRLTEALVAVDRVTSEAWTNRLRSTLKIDISLTNVAAGAMAGASAAASFALPIEFGAGLGAVGAVVKFELKPDAVGAKVVNGVSRLTYARRVERELGQA